MSFSDAYVPFVGLDPNPFDLIGVEVLKGPQGTLFGASALNGAIRYTPQTPELGVWSAKYYYQHIEYNQGGNGSNYGGALNVPIGDNDSMAIRVVAFEREQPGYIDNLRSGVTDSNTIDQRGIRGMLRWLPSEKSELSFLYALQETETADTAIADNRNGDLENNIRPRLSPSENQYELYNLTLSYELDWASIVSDSAVVLKNGFNFFDASSRIEPSGSMAISAQVYPSESETLSQEFRMQSLDGQDTNWDWMAGAFFFRQDITQALEVPFGDNSIPLGDLIAQLAQVAPPYAALVSSTDQPLVLAAEPDVSIKEFAIFGDVTRHFGPNWELSLGGRLYKTESGGTNTQRGAFIVATRGEPEYVLAGGVKENGFNPKASLTWRANEDILTYAAISQGFRVGGLQVGVSTPVSSKPAPDTFKSDTLWNYELGVRTQWLDNTLKLDITAFYVDWQDPQSVQADASGLAVYLDNVGGVETQGLDAAFQYLFPWAEHLQLSVSAAYSETVTTEPFTASNGTIVPNGSQWSLAPEWQTATTLSYAKTLGPWRISSLITHTFLDDAISDLVGKRPVFGYQQVDLQLGLANNDIQWLPDISFIVNNALDERGITNEFSSGVPSPEEAAVETYYIAPRSINIRLSGSF